jgi:hypothetical protein
MDPVVESNALKKMKLELERLNEELIRTDLEIKLSQERRRQFNEDMKQKALTRHYELQKSYSLLHPKKRKTS